VAKVMKEALAAKHLNMTFSNEIRDKIAECSKEFIMLIASEASELVTKLNKTKIDHAHLITALESLEFKHLVPYAQAAQEKEKLDSIAKPKKGKRKLENLGKSMDDLRDRQQQLFAKARARQQGLTTLGTSSTRAGLTVSPAASPVANSPAASPR